jgi:hypothetical protein
MPDLFDSERNLWHVQIRCDQRQCGTRYSICTQVPTSYTQVPTSAGCDDVLYILLHANRGVTAETRNTSLTHNGSGLRGPSPAESSGVGVSMPGLLMSHPGGNTGFKTLLSPTIR